MRVILAFLCFMLVSVSAWALTPAMIGAVSHAGCPTHGTDWSTWNGTNNGVMVEDYLGTQQWNTGTYANLTDDTALHAYTTTTDSGTNYRLETAIVTMDANCKTLTRGTPTVLKTWSAVASLPSMAKMSATRFLVVASVTGANALEAYLVDNTGALIDSDTLANQITNGGSGFEIASHSSTIAVVGFRRQSDSDLGAVAIDITGDNIVFGTPVELKDLVSVSQSGPSVVAVTSTRGMMIDANAATRYTLSGTTISYGAEIAPDSLASIWAGSGTYRGILIAANTVLITYKPAYGGASGKLRASVVTDDGTTMSRAAQLYITSAYGTVALKSRHSTEVRQYSAGVNNGLYLVAFEDTNNDCAVNMISWSGSAIALERETTLGTSVVFCEHVLAHKFDNGLVAAHWQDDVYWDWQVLSP